MSNLGALRNNVLMGLETENGQAAFLWASSLKDADRYLYKAEEFAHYVERLSLIMMGMIEMASKYHNISVEKKGDLFKFIMKRHSYMSFPGTRTCWTQCEHSNS